MTLQDFFSKGVLHAVFKGVFFSFIILWYFSRGVLHAVFKGVLISIFRYL